MNFFSPDSKFAQVMTSLGEMMLLNLCWIIGSLPLVTMGAASTAMYTVMGRRLRGEGSGTIRPFFKAWLSNLKMSTLFWLPQLFITASLCWTQLLPLPGAMKVIAAVVLVLATLVLSVIYPQIARFRNRGFAYLKNAVILLVLRLKWVVLNLLIFAAPLLAFLLFPAEFLQLGFVWLLFGFSGLYYLSARIMPKILQPLDELTTAKK